MQSSYSRWHIWTVLLLMIGVAVLVYLGSFHNGSQWIANVVVVVIALGSWLLPRLVFSAPQMHIVKAFFAKWGVLIPVTILALLIVWDILALTGHNPFQPVAQNLGGVDLDGYCRSIGDKRVSLDGKTAFDWHCITQSNKHVGIYMRAVCQWQFPKVPAESIMERYGDFNNPYSWHCYEVNH